MTVTWESELEFLMGSQTDVLMAQKMELRWDPESESPWGEPTGLMWEKLSVPQCRIQHQLFDLRKLYSLPKCSRSHRSLRCPRVVVQFAAL